eukprot:gene26744-biopygen17279
MNSCHEEVSARVCSVCQSAVLEWQVNNYLGGWEMR